MRVEETINKKGYFWVPGNAGNKVSGSLTIQDTGKIELQIIGALIEGADRFENKIPIILGEIEQVGLVTLFDSFYLKYPSSGNVFTEKLFVNEAVIGIHCEKSGQLKGQSLRFEIEGLQEWLGVTGIRKQYADLGENENIRITYVFPEPVRFSLTGSFIGTITHRYKDCNTYPIKGVTLKETVYFELSSKEERYYKEMRKIALQVTNFFSFVIDQLMSIKNVILVGKEDSEFQEGIGLNIPRNMRLYFQSVNCLPNTPQISLQDMFFRYHDLSLDLGEVINSWLDCYRDFPQAMAAFFSIRNGDINSLSGKYLTLMQGLESYHRGLRKRESLKEDAKFRERLEELIRPFSSYFGSNREQKALLTNIVKTRNYYTHFDDGIRLDPDYNLFKLFNKVELLMILRLLKELKFSHCEIKNIVQTTSRLYKQWKLQ